MNVLLISPTKKVDVTRKRNNPTEDSEWRVSQEHPKTREMSSSCVQVVDLAETHSYVLESREE